MSAAVTPEAVAGQVVVAPAAAAVLEVAAVVPRVLPPYFP